MASNDHVSDFGEEDSQVDTVRTPEELASPLSGLSIRNRDPSPKPVDRTEGKTSAEDSIAVIVSGPERPWEYKSYDEDKTVHSVLEEINGPDGSPWYTIEYESGREERIPLDKLLRLKRGQASLDLYNNPTSSSTSDEGNMAAKDKRDRNKVATEGFVDSAATHSESEADDSNLRVRRVKRKVESTADGTRQSSRIGNRPASRPTNNEDLMELDSNDENISPQTLSSRPNAASPRITRSTANPSRSISQLVVADEDDTSGVVSASDDDDGDAIRYVQSKKKGLRPSNQRSSLQTQTKGKKVKPLRDDTPSEDERTEPSRRSGRDRGIKASMQEMDLSDEVFADDVDVDVAKPKIAKILNVKEIFKPLPKDSKFRTIHSHTCDICKEASDDGNPLILCQGCNTSIHRGCLGSRSSRQHLVTKVGEGDFVLQCRRCVDSTLKKDATSPQLDHCQVCHEVGHSCLPFSVRQKAKEEEKLRDANGGVDPINEVSEVLLNNEATLLFRCSTCRRAYHFEHLPALNDGMNKLSATDKNDMSTPDKDEMSTSDNIHDIREARIDEYRSRVNCNDCSVMETDETKVQGLIAWRPREGVSKTKEDTYDGLREDDKEYLVKWAHQSYFKRKWMPGAWVWGVTAPSMRKAFFNKAGNRLPVLTPDDSIPPDYLRMDIVLDVKYKGRFTPKTESQGRDSIDKVDTVLVKFVGLTYADVVWQSPPPKNNEDLWSHYEAAYHEYLRGIFFSSCPKSEMDARLAEFQTKNFEKHLLLKKPPPTRYRSDGRKLELMKHQFDGVNWLRYNLSIKQNVILADDMGLGKTIQIIAFIASLVKKTPRCWPFLVVAPNSTCENWRREFKEWAPELRIVSYYGGQKSREMVRKYELFPGEDLDKGGKLAAHVVITSYEAPFDKKSDIFLNIGWFGLFVDEAQRLKNDDNLIFQSLSTLKTSHLVLLTGTPLQNKNKELFTLLQFLDPKIYNAEALDKEYGEINDNNLGLIHALLQPLILRRTKMKVLHNLPPMAQVIIPVTMTVVQKLVYKSILSKNAGLIKALLGQPDKKQRQERGNLNNILMTLRQVLCHPFLYSRKIEEQTDDENVAFRNLIDASAKFKLLEIMLPKLKARGHRVLMFSQFLGQLDHVEDFMIGLNLSYLRFDGSMDALQKDKVIHDFSCEGSTIFAMLLSTRAGGVGINLAAADTVIIMDPDYNPHQDMQALSRAHRIGQKKKVLVFQLMTKDTAEEKIFQVGRKKLALDRLLIASMGTDEDGPVVDVESILKHGAAALFSEEDGENNDIRYDSAAVDKLLDRTNITKTSADDKDKASGQSQFSIAKIWLNDKGSMSNDIGNADAAPGPTSESAWEMILERRELQAKLDAERNAETLGRGQRTKQNVVYETPNNDIDDVDGTPNKQRGRKRRTPRESDVDRDFSSNQSSSERGVDSEVDGIIGFDEPSSKARGNEPRVPLRTTKLASSGSSQLHDRLSSAERFSSGPSGIPVLSSAHIPYSSSIHPGASLLSSGRQYGSTSTHVVPSTGSYAGSGLSTGRPNGWNHQHVVPSNSQPNQYPRQRPQEPPLISISRPDFLMQQYAPGNHSSSNMQLNSSNFAPPCNACKLDHYNFSRTCPQALSNSKIRVLLDGLDRSSPKQLTLYSELRWILAARAEHKPVQS